MVAREDHSPVRWDLLAARCVFDRDKALDEIEERVLLEDLFPQVGGLVPVRVVGVACSAVTAPIEGEEPGAVEGQLRRHMHFVGIDGEVHECPGRVGEERVFGVAIGAVLLNSVPVGLPGGRVLEFGGYDRYPLTNSTRSTVLACPPAASRGT